MQKSKKRPPEGIENDSKWVDSGGQANQKNGMTQIESLIYHGFQTEGSSGLCHAWWSKIQQKMHSVSDLKNSPERRV